LTVAGRPTRRELRRQRSRARIRRRARSVVALLVVAGMAVFAYGFSASVEVVVDGETHGLRTFSGTVEEVLDQLDVEVRPADVVEPDLATAVSDGMSIGIARAKTVDIAIDGSVARRVTAPVGSVAGVLELADMDHLEELGARIHPNRRAEVADGDVISVTLPVPVTVVADGEEIEFETFASEIGDVLEQAGVELDDNDIVVPGDEGALVGPTTLTVRRVAIDEEVEEVALDFDEVRRESSDLDRGTTRVEQEGRAGLRLDVYHLTYVDGEEAERELVEQEIVREPQDRIVIVGTRAPQPAASSDSSSSESSSSGSSSSGSSSSGSSSGGSASDDSVWDRLAQCESGGNWHINTGNGYYGGLQFHPDTWRSVGGSGLPHEHSREEQIKRGKILQQRSGWGQWPSCSRQLGLR
jgi:resuscitation-promoting factor RpfB